jgi:DNA-binding response OmpR family regulator
MIRTRALVVDDEVGLAELLREYLAAEGMEVALAGDGPAAVQKARLWQPDLVVLDVMLPGIDGFEVLRELRTFSDAYVMMLTARAEEIDRVIGLSVGADDYVVKPFSPRELVARVKALLRRPRASTRSRERFRQGDLEIDRPTRTVTMRGEAVPLTALEFNLLAALADEPGVVFSRQRLLDRVWGMDFVGDEHVVDVHLANLRRKLGEESQRPSFIETVRGVGYRFRSGRGAA